jgi:hypothetical protein
VPTELQGQKRKKRTTTLGTQSSGTREEPLPKKHTLETVYWAKSMINQPPQYVLNAKDDYTRTLKKQYEKRDIPQLGQQEKQSIPPPGISRSSLGVRHGRSRETSGPNEYHCG